MFYYGVNLSSAILFCSPSGDPRVLSPLVRNKQLYLPVTSTLTELSGLELKQNTGSLSGFVESSIHTKSRSRQNSQGISSQASGNNVSFSLVFFFVCLFCLFTYFYYYYLNGI